MVAAALFFGSSVNTLVKKGLRSDYVRCEGNLSYLKGKLNTARQLRQNIITKHKFHCEYDEFLVDRPANRLLHSALAAITLSGNNQRLLQEMTLISPLLATSPCVYGRCHL
ncbi:5-methylcytosine restriction system specificity protein McrC [Aeromonas hydrophila]|uniref:5-methylcytosine restriction system specificity protein McrC n=1 Tax=Aeromonas hydrophila TaxID=644 RepID=UPI003F7955B7